MICGTYGAKNLSAFINGFFYYLCHLENPQNGIDIKRCLEDCLTGNILKSKHPDVLADERKAAAAFKYFEEYLGVESYLYVLRKRGIKNVLHTHSSIHELCEATYYNIGVVILEDDMRRYLREWYDKMKNTDCFEAVELKVLKSGGIRDAANVEEE